MVSVGDDALNQDLVDQGAIGQLVGKFLFNSLQDNLGIIALCEMNGGNSPFRKGGRNSLGYKTCCCVVLYCGLYIDSVF